jgi:hypothetical protein
MGAVGLKAVHVVAKTKPEAIQRKPQRNSGLLHRFALHNDDRGVLRCW